MTGYPRRPLDRAAYVRRARATCFVCATVAGHPDYRHHIVHRDAATIAFLNRWPWLLGHLLVAPVRHQEELAGDVEAYLRLQRVVHAAALALPATVPTERVYALSLGSRLGNPHVHWHVVALPPGVAYEEQELHALGGDRGYLDVPDQAMAELAGQPATRMASAL